MNMLETIGKKPIILSICLSLNLTNLLIFFNKLAVVVRAHQWTVFYGLVDGSGGQRSRLAVACRQAAGDRDARRFGAPDRDRSLPLQLFHPAPGAPVCRRQHLPIGGLVVSPQAHPRREVLGTRSRRVLGSTFAVNLSARSGPRPLLCFKSMASGASRGFHRLQHVQHVRRHLNSRLRNFRAVTFAQGCIAIGVA